MVTYSVQLEPQEEGGFTVTVPSLPGCISEGETLEEALENVKDAIEGYIHVLAKHSPASKHECGRFDKHSLRDRLKRVIP